MKDQHNDPLSLKGAALVEKEKRRAKVRPHDLVKDLLGSVRGGVPDRSTDVGKKVRRMLQARRQRP